MFTDPGTGVKSVGFWLDDPTGSAPRRTPRRPGLTTTSAARPQPLSVEHHRRPRRDSHHHAGRDPDDGCGAGAHRDLHHRQHDRDPDTDGHSDPDRHPHAHADPHTHTHTAGGCHRLGSLQPTNLDWTRSAAGTTIGGLLGPALTNFRYVMNRIGFDTVDKTATLHVKPDATARLRNTGTTPITITAITTTGPFALQTNLVGPQVIAPGGTLDVTVLFNYCRTGCTTATPKGVQSGSLVVTSNDPGFTTSRSPSTAPGSSATAGPASSRSSSSSTPSSASGRC